MLVRFFRNFRGFVDLVFVSCVTRGFAVAGSGPRLRPQRAYKPAECLGERLVTPPRSLMGISWRSTREGATRLQIGMFDHLIQNTPSRCRSRCSALLSCPSVWAFTVAVAIAEMETRNRRQLLQIEAWTTPPSLLCATQRMWTRTNSRSLLGTSKVACSA